MVSLRRGIFRNFRKEAFPLSESCMIYERGWKIEPDHFLSGAWVLSEFKKWVARETELQTKSSLKLSVSFPLKKFAIPSNLLYKSSIN